jgi:hypothetical protein
MGSGAGIQVISSILVYIKYINAYINNINILITSRFIDILKIFF